MNVFVSFSGNDRLVKDQLTAALRNELDPDDQVWESDEGCTSDYSAESIRALRQAQVFIVVLSASSMAPTSYVFNEVVEARQREMHGELDMMIFQVDDAPLTDRFVMQLNHISDANHIGRVFRNTEAGIRGSVAKVRYLLSRRKKGEPEKPFDVFRPEILGSKLSGPGFFVDHSRDDVLWNIDEAFARSNIVFALQFGGYGRRSAVRKYAELHAADYEQILFFPLFKGSISDFFVSGLSITNINSCVFDDLDDRGSILKKKELLKKLDARTLLVVPDTVPGNKDDRFICDVLAELPCRIMFVVESVPRLFRERFPVINVDRMEDEYLMRMFFHYYTHADAEEADALRQPLLDFFNAVDGHTKTVELAATVLEDEYVFPDQVPETLSTMTPSEEDELGSRIFSSISHLFDLKGFDDNAKRILLCVTLLADMPIDERTFVEVLRKCGGFDARQLGRLTDLRWLNKDTENRTFSIDPLISKVCLARIPMDEQVLDECLLKLCDSLYDEIIDNTRSWRQLRRFQRIWKLLGMNSCAEAVENLLESQEILDSTLNEEDRHRLQEAVIGECNRLPERSRQECIDTLWGYVFSALLTLSASNDLSSREAQKSFQDAYFEALYQNQKKAFLSIMNSDTPSEIKVFLERMAGIGSLQQLIGYYLSAAKMITKKNALMDAGEEYYGAVLFLLENIGTFMDGFLASDPYTRIQVCRARAELMELEGRFSSTNLFYLYAAMTDSLIEMSEYTEELDEAFETTVDCFDKNIWATEEEAYNVLYTVMRKYLRAMLLAEQPQKAEEVCCSILELPIKGEEYFCQITGDISAISNAYLKKGETERVPGFLEHALPMVADLKPRIAKDSSQLSDTYNTLKFLVDIHKVLTEPKEYKGFKDDSASYTSYYETYPSESADRRRMSRYTQIAEKAKALDLSALSQEEMLARIEALSRRAKKGEDWEVLAPETFALVSEAGFRTLGYRHHLVQYIGAAAILDNNIAEMQNGEGKTYTIVLAAVLHSLYGRQVHILDSSAYLCHRNYVWMRGLLEYLGRTVGIIESRPNDKSVFEHLSRCDVIYSLFSEESFYILNTELGGSFYRDNPLRLDAAIVDEADETMLVGSSDIRIVENTGDDHRFLFKAAEQVISGLRPDDEKYYSCKNGIVNLRPPIFSLAEAELGQELYTLSPIHQSILDMALKVGIIAHFYYERDKDYYIQTSKNGTPVIMRESVSSGTFYQIGNEWAYFIWNKEGRPDLAGRVPLIERSVLTEWDKVSYFRSFRILSGTSATASGFAKLFRSIYGLSVFPVPPNVPVIRRDETAQVYFNKAAKEKAIASLVVKKHKAGQPVLLITGSVPESRRMTQLLVDKGLRPALINAANAEEEPERLSCAGEAGAVTVTTAMANRGVDISLGGDPSFYARRTLLQAGVDQADLDRAVSGMAGGGSEQMLLRRYTDLCALQWRRISKEKARLVDLGGLCVIGTTCFDDLRVEQQMRGRCGRQGDPGESYVFYSLEDDTLKALLGDRYYQIRSVMERLEVEDENINSSFLERSLTEARKRLQTFLYSRIDETPSILYYQDARRLILGQIPKFYSDDLDFRGFLVDLFRKDPRYKRDQDELQAKGPEKMPSTSLVRGVCGRNMALASLRSAKLPEPLADKLCSVYDPGSVPIRRFVSDNLSAAARDAWKLYLSRMRDEIASAERLFNNEAKKRRHLTDFSKKNSELFYRDAIERALLKIYMKLRSVKSRTNIYRPPADPVRPDQGPGDTSDKT